MLISYNELCEFAERGVISPVDPKDINGTSIDVHLGPKILREQAVFLANGTEGLGIVSLRDKQNVHWEEVDIEYEGYYDLHPGEFILAHTVEVFDLPADISAEFKLNSSGARIGLDNALATWADPRWHGSTLTLELKNNTRFHVIRLHHGCRIGQMIFHRSEPVPEEKSYAVRGRYLNDKSVQTVK